MHHTTERTPRADHDLKPCPRCGIRRTVNASRRSGLCIDCRHVAIDLEELRKWTP